MGLPNHFGKNVSVVSWMLLSASVFALSGCGFKFGLDRDALYALYQNGAIAGGTINPATNPTITPVRIVPGTGTASNPNGSSSGGSAASGPDAGNVPPYSSPSQDHDWDGGSGGYGGGHGDGYGDGYGSGYDMPWQQKSPSYKKPMPMSKGPSQKKGSGSYPGDYGSGGYGGGGGSYGGGGDGYGGSGGSGYDSTRHTSVRRAVTGAPGIRVGEGCQSASGERNARLCIGLKYVVYREPRSGVPIELPSDVLRNVEDINRIWDECGIGFQVESYLAADAEQYALRYRTANYDELNSIRDRFADEDHLLVVLTGEWNRRGTLGGTPANAWTNMPGDGIYGAILEGPMRRTPYLIAHELGHYLGLDHVDDWADLMNPIVAPTSRRLDRNQCRRARQVVQQEWSNALR